MENPKVEPILLKGPSLKADFERLGNMDVEVMIFYCNMKTKELQPKYCGTQEMMNVAKNTELGKKFVNEFLACCEEINAQKKKIADLQKEADKNLLENMTLDMSVEEVVNEAVVTRIKEEEFSESTESETTEKEVGPVGKENDYMWSQMLTNFVRMVGEYENTQKNEKTHGQGSQSGADSMGAKNNDENQPKDEISGVKIKTEPIDPDDEMIPQANQNVIGMDYSNVNSQIAVSTGSSVSTTVAVTTSVLATALQSNFSSQSQNISNSNAHAVAGTSVSVGGPVGATSTGGVAVMPGSTPNSLSLKMIGNKLYFVLPCSMNVPLQQVVSKASVTQSITNPTGNPLMAVQNIGLPGLQGSTLAQNVPINTGAAANTFVSPQNIAIPTPTVNTSVQNVVLSNMGLVAGKTESLQNLVTPNMGLAANTQVPVLNVLPGATANTSDIGLTPRRILPQALQQTNTGQVPVLGTIEGTSAANSDKTLKSNVVMPTVEPVLQSKQTASRERKMVQTTAVAQRSGRKSPPCVEPSAKRQKTDAESLVSSKKSNSIQHTSKNDNISAKNTVTVAKDGDIVYNTYMLPSGVYRDGMPHISAITTATAPSLQEGDTSTSPVPCSSKSSMSLPPGTSFDGGPTSADEQVCDDDDDDNVDDDENKDDDDEGGAENTTENGTSSSQKEKDYMKTVRGMLNKGPQKSNVTQGAESVIGPMASIGDEQSNIERAAYLKIAMWARDKSLQTKISQLSVSGMKGLILEICKRNPSIVLDVVDALSHQSRADIQKPTQKSPSWCLCSHCKEMPSEKEKVCCMQTPNNCYSKLPDFIILVLDEAVLGIAQRFREELLVLKKDQDWNRGNRHAAYRQFLLWNYGRLGDCNKHVLPSCCVCEIREKYPDPFGQYHEFTVGRLT